jgi:hypothetical protein
MRIIDDAERLDKAVDYLIDCSKKSHHPDLKSKFWDLAGDLEIWESENSLEEFVVNRGD